jgi:cell division protein ZapA (FtsZ GTPase activity inhibitor)
MLPSQIRCAARGIVNLIIDKVRRLAHGFRTFDHDRIRIMLTA